MPEQPLHRGAIPPEKIPFDTTSIPGKTYLFVIGIDGYQHPIVPLNNAVSDATAFANLLIDTYQYNGNAPYFKKLINTDATKQAIFDQLDTYTRLTADDNLIIYFSGHGEYKSNIDEGFWICADSTQQRSTFLSFSDIKTYIRAIPARHILLILDSCYSGSFFGKARMSQMSAGRALQTPSRWVLTAGRNQPVPDGKPGQKSPFAAALIKHLSINDGFLSISELGNLVYDTVVSSSDSAQEPRCEPLQVHGHEGGAFVFIHPNADLSQLDSQPAFDKRTTDSPIPDTSETQHRNPTPENLEEAKSTLKNGIIKDQVEKVFDDLEVFTKKGCLDENTLILLQSQWNSNERQNRSGLIAPGDYERTRNRIKHGLLGVINDMEC